MNTIRCTNCGNTVFKSVNGDDIKCPYCGVPIQSEDFTEERKSFQDKVSAVQTIDAKNSQVNFIVGGILVFIVLIFIILIINVASSSGGSSRRNRYGDSKCDICGRTASYDDGSREMCRDCFNSFIEWLDKQ